MSQKDQSEMIVRMAEVLKKNADGDGLAETGAEMVGEGLAFEGGIQLAKKLLPWAAGALGAGTGAAGLTAVLSNPITLGILGTAIVGAGIYAIYKNHKYKDAIDEAIENMKTLDPNDKIKPTIDAWISLLQKYSDALILPTISDDPKEQAAVWKKYVTTLENANKVVNGMINKWQNMIAPNLDDIGSDPEDTLKALNKAVLEINNATEQGKSYLSKIVSQKIKQVGKEQKTDYSAVANSVLSNYSKVREMTDVEPTLEPVEQKAFELAKSIVDGNVDQDDFNSYYKNMLKLNTDLAQGVAILNNQLKTRHSSDNTSSISKRALKINFQSGKSIDVGESKGKSQSGTKNQLVSELQDTLNDLSVALKLNIPRLTVDGIWGPQSAVALTSFLGMGKVGDFFAKFGISEEVVNDPSFAKSKYLGRAVNVLRQLSNTVSENSKPSLSSNEEQKNIEKSQSKQTVEQVGCDLDKINPSSAEILACLRSRDAIDPATKENVNIYELGSRLGFSEDQMVRYILDIYRGRAPRNWDTQAILRDWNGQGSRSLF